ncbi:hypothetical protein OAV88_03505 [bacterium]|nr:hypothetical protein [bacterium]
MCVWNSEAPKYSQTPPLVRDRHVRFLLMLFYLNESKEQEEG